MLTKTATFSEFKPFESMRYKVHKDGFLVGYVSRFYYDGRNHWVMWNNEGVHSERRSLKDAMAAWEDYTPGQGFKVRQ